MLVGLQLGQRLGGLVDLALQLGHLAVADLRRPGQVLLPVDGAPQGLQLLLQHPDGGDGILLGPPVGLHPVRGLTQVGQFLVQLGQPLDRGQVGLLLQRHPLDLQLADPPLDHVDLGGHGVDLDAQPAARLVDQVDGLVGQEPPGDVPVAQHRGRDQSGVLDPDAVVHLIALLQAPEDGDGRLDRRLADVHLLEPSLQGGVLLDPLAVLVEGGGADHAQLATGQHGLEHVARVHRPLGRSGTDDGVQFVDEGDDLAAGVGDLLQDRLQPLLELAPVLGPRHHGTQVEGQEPLVLQALGDVALHDAPGQALHDGRLAHARFADQHGVVLGPPGQHLDDSADLLVPADDRVELALAGFLGQIPAVLLQRLVLLLGVLAGDAMTSSDLLEGLQQVLPAHRQSLPFAGHGQEDVLDRQVLVAQAAALAVGPAEGLPQLPAQLDVRSLPAVAPRQLGDGIFEPVAHADRRQADLGQHRQYHRRLLAEHGQEQVVRRHLGVVAAASGLGGGIERLLGLQRPPIGIEGHSSASSSENLSVMLSTFAALAGEKVRQPCPVVSRPRR